MTRLIGRFLKGKLPTGIDRVCLAYVAQYGKESSALIRIRSTYHIIPILIAQEIFSILQTSNKTQRIRLIWLIMRSVFVSKTDNMQGQIMFNVGHMGLDRKEYPDVIRQMGVKPVFMVHDLIPIRYPEYSRVGEKNRHEHRMDCILDTAFAIVTNSISTLDELNTYAKSRKKHMPKSIAALLGTLNLTKIPSVSPISFPYFVVLGTIEARKNHLLLLNIWRDLVTIMGENAPRLILIGQRGWECENVLDMLERCETFQEYVIEIPLCSDIMLSSYLQHARALLFPSFAEGYGMPLAEALSLGVPVIASDLPVFREIAHTIPEYIHPLDGLGWKNMIIAYTHESSPQRKSQIDRLLGFTLPAWNDHFLRVNELIYQKDGISV